MNTPMLEVTELKGGGFGPVNLTLDAGECLGISGPSGSGKSRMLRAIADLDPHGGRVRLRGRDRMTFSGPQWRSRVGYVPADSRWWARTVQEHFLRPGALPLEDLGLEAGILDFAGHRLSSGERQRLALLRQWELQPQVLLLDEPTANLDTTNRDRFEAFVLRYRDEVQAALLWVSHDREQLRRVANRPLRMQAGRPV